MNTSTRFTDEAANVLDRSLREALQLGHNRINTEHILLAIARSDTLAARALAALGVDKAKVRNQVIELLVQAEAVRRSPLPPPPRCTSLSPRLSPPYYTTGVRCVLGAGHGGWHSEGVQPTSMQWPP